MSEPARPSVLVVDDDDSYRSALARAFERRGFDVRSANGIAAALALCSNAAPDYASIDLRMPDGSGLELVRRLSALHPSTILVVLTGYGSIATAVEAVQLGAANYLTKPADVNDLLRAFGTARAVSRSSARAPQAPLASSPTQVPSLARVEWEHISRVLADCGGNISKAARLLRLQRRSLQRKLAKYPVSK